MWATDDIGIVLPYDGVSEIRSKSMLCDLISGHSTVLPSVDVPALQQDLKHLTLRQLLRVRVRLGSCSTSDNVSVRALLLELETVLFEKLSDIGIGTIFPCMDHDTGQRSGRDLVILTAAAAVVPEPAWWAYRIGDQTVFFHPHSFTALEQFPSSKGGVLSISDVSRHDRRQKRFIDWKIAVVESAVALGSASSTEFSKSNQTPTTACTSNSNTDSDSAIPDTKKGKSLRDAVLNVPRPCD